jgi:hypothetical protein
MNLKVYLHGRMFPSNLHCLPVHLFQIQIWTGLYKSGLGCINLDWVVQIRTGLHKSGLGCTNLDWVAQIWTELYKSGLGCTNLDWVAQSTIKVNLLLKVHKMYYWKLIVNYFCCTNSINVNRLLTFEYI